MGRRGDKGRESHCGDRLGGPGEVLKELTTLMAKDWTEAARQLSELLVNRNHRRRRVFQMYASGKGLAHIAKQFNAEGVPAPQPPRTRHIQAWCPSSIHEMLRNERYRGVHIWNRTEKQRNPETGRKISRRRPQSEWLRVEVPEWRIVPEELWSAAHAKISLVRERFGVKRVGGMTRTERARTYLFSGLLICGLCGARIVIVSGNGKRGYVKYGCPSHRYRGICSNTLTIRQDRLEEQLLSALEERVFKPEVIACTLRRFEESLRRRLEELRKQGTAASSSLTVLHEERRSLQAKAKRVTEAIAEAGHSPSLLSQLASIESQIVRVDERITAHKPLDLTVTLNRVKEFVSSNILNLRSLLQDDVPAARAALMKHVRPLILTPQETLTGPVFDVSGGVDLAAGQEYVMQVVARDGYPQHSSLLSIPLIDVFLDPRLPTTGASDARCH